jgi:hypothetical protein
MSHPEFFRNLLYSKNIAKSEKCGIGKKDLLSYTVKMKTQAANSGGLLTSMQSKYEDNSVMSSRGLFGFWSGFMWISGAERTRTSNTRFRNSGSMVYTHLSMPIPSSKPKANVHERTSKSTDIYRRCCHGCCQAQPSDLWAEACLATRYGR